MQAVVRVLLTLFVVAAAAVVGYDTAHYYFFSPWTRDARVTADICHDRTGCLWICH